MTAATAMTRQGGTFVREDKTNDHCQERQYGQDQYSIHAESSN
jgi:hypothetical protein